MKLPEVRIFLKVKISVKANSPKFGKLNGNNFLQSRSCTAMFVVSFANLKSCAVFCNTSVDQVLEPRLLIEILLL